MGTPRPFDLWGQGSMSTRNSEEESMLVGKKDRIKTMEKVNSWIRGSLIGAGAFGKVNLALNRENGELFAVKSIESNERSSKETQEMENEIQILECLNSPFIVKCLGSSFSVENGKSMRNVFMEYMSGGSVADLMKKFGGHLEEPLIRNYTRSILEGIQYLHAQDIVHCDIKCRNVLVGSIGDVKLADFGGARRLDGEAAVMLDSDVLKVKGTPLWMAPEVARQIEQGPASDIWSLGCTVVEMATGKAPWSNIKAGISNPFVALYHIGCTEEVPDLPSCLSEQGQDFLTKCFQRDPRARWTAAQLLRHPFISEHFFTIQSIKPTEDHFNQCSPTSAFDFPSSSATLTTSIVNSVPILRSPLFTKRRPQQQQQQQVATNFLQTDQEKHKQRTTGTSSSATGTDFWCNSPLSDPPGQWIVVRTPMTISSIVSATSSSTSHELVGIAMVEEEDATILISQKRKGASLEVKDEILEIPLSASTEREVRMDADEQPESLEITTEQASCSTANESSTYHNKWNETVEEDGSISGGALKEESRDCGRGAGWRTSSTIGRERRKFLRTQPDSDHVGDYDLRCIDHRGRLKPKWASLRATLRILTSAHRKVAFRCRSNSRQRLRIRRKLQESLNRKFVMSKKSMCSFAFRKTLCPHDRSPEKLVGSLLSTKVQPSFFRNRLFLNT